MAANRIQGITVEIGGDTTKLTTALKGVNSEIKSTQAQLRDVEKLLKLDPGNTELLVQKQKLLTQAISETKEKLESLKQASEQANEQLKNGTITQAQYDGLQREIIETEEKLKGLEKQADAASVALVKIGQTGEKLKAAGDSISGLGNKLLPITGAVAALGTAAVKTAADFETSMSQVAAVSGASGDELEQLTAKAREMGEKTKFSASEAADAMNYMAMAGWKTSDMLSGIDGIMSLAAASGEDLATTSDIVTDALTAFGLTAADSGHFADILAAASSNANTNVSMMGETFKYAAPVAGALGYTAEDVAEAIGLMANAGIKSTQAGTSLRTMLTSLTGDIKLSGRSFGEVTVQTTNADGSMRSLGDIITDLRGYFSQMTESEAASTAEMLVGKNAMSGFLAVMQAAPADIEKLNTAIGNCDGQSEKMAATMQDNLNGQLTILKSQLQELAISFGETLMPVIRQLVSFIQGLVDKLNGMDKGTRNMIITIGLVAAAVGPVLIVIGKVITAIGTIMTVFSKLGAVIGVVKGAFAALSAVMLANPIGLIIAAIAALVAAFILLWNNCDGFRQFWIDLWNNVKEVAIACWNGIKDFFSGIWNAITSLAQSIWGGLKSFFSGLWDGIKSIFTTVLDAIKSVIEFRFNLYKTIITTVLNAIKTVVTAVWDAISGIIKSVVEGISSFLSSAWDKIKSVISGALDAIKNVVTSAWDAIKNAVSSAMETLKNVTVQAWNSLKEVVISIMDAIKTAIQNAWESIKEAVSKVMESIKDLCEKAWTAIKTVVTKVITEIKDVTVRIWDSIKEAIGKVMETIKNLMSTAWNAVKSTITTVLGYVKDAIVSIFTNIASAIKSTMGNVISSIKDIFGSIKDVVMGLAKSAFEWGKDIIMGIVNGIKSCISHVVDAAKGVAETIANFLHFSVPDEGPLTEYESWMPDFMKGLADGIEKSRGMIRSAVNDVAGDMTVSPMINGTVSPQSMLMDSLMNANVVSGKNEENNAALGAKLDAMTSLMSRYLPKMADSKIVLDSGALVGELSDGLNRQLGKAYL